MVERTPTRNRSKLRQLALVGVLALLIGGGCATQDRVTNKDQLSDLEAGASKISASAPSALGLKVLDEIVALDEGLKQTITPGPRSLAATPESTRIHKSAKTIPVMLARPEDNPSKVLSLIDPLDRTRADGKEAVDSSIALAAQDSTEPRAPEATPRPESAPVAQPRSQGFWQIEAGATPPSIPQATPPQPIDLPSALRLADNQNPVIGEARILILAALAQRQNAYALLLPTFNAGTNYHDHVGVLQRSSGTILPVNEQSLYFGGGARAVAAESVGIPAVNIISPLTDAIFEPLAAQQRVRGAQANAAASANSVLLEVARLYLRLLGAQAIYEARKVTAAESDQIAASVLAFATSGEGRRSDASRADADRRLIQTQIFRAEEFMAVTSAELSEQLNLDPSARLQPMSSGVVPIELIDPNIPVTVLIQIALSRRPDLEVRNAVLAEAGYQVRKEKNRPLLPTVWISFSGGAFGGGSNLVPPTFSAVAGRTDFDARAYWTLLNFGAGNSALIKQRKAQSGQAEAERVRVINAIRSQVTSSRSLALSLKNRVEVAQIRLRSAEDGYSQDRVRLRETLAKPIEALDSLQLLNEARVALILAITEYNQVQFDLFVALGSPPPLDTPLRSPGESQ